MSRKRTRLAVILGDVLRILGLKVVLKAVNPTATIDSFGTLDEYRATGHEEYDILYVEDSIIALNSEYFRGKRYHLIPILTGINPAEISSNNIQGTTFIHTGWDYQTLEAALLDSFETNQIILDSTSDKGLSSREVDVLKEVARGLTNKEIADTLNISMNTVMTHRKNITAKLNIKTVSGLTFYALMNNLVSGNEVVERASE